MPDTQRLLQLALKGLEAERAAIDSEIANLKRELGFTSNKVPASSTTGGPAKRRTMSAAARRKISEGMKRRYAQMRGGQRPQQAKAGAGGGLTSAGRKKLSDMMKARWAAKKKASKKAA